MTTYMQEEIDVDAIPRKTDVPVCTTMTSHPEALTDRELENVTAVFRSFESGLREATISSHDLHKALLMLGLNPSEQEVVDMPNEIARKGLIYFPDFCDLCLERFREGEDADDNFRKTIFKIMCGTDPFPTDYRAKKYRVDKHFLTKEDFTEIMKNLPVPVEDADIEEMFAFADTDGDGSLSFQEFEKMVKPIEPPAVLKPHISDIGMQPQVFSPPSPSSCPPPSNFASPLLPHRASLSASRSSLASAASTTKKPSSNSTLTVKIGSAKSSVTGSSQQIAHV